MAQNGSDSSATPTDKSKDALYLELISSALQVCAKYKPKFGKGGDKGLSVEEFQTLYHADPFYSWVGLDSPLVYAAHKAAGGMTSIYRQLGIGCERIFRKMLQDYLGLSASQASWSYEIPVPGKKPRVLKLDGRIQLDHVKNKAGRERVQSWLTAATNKFPLSDQMKKSLQGAVFEVRQGYKSMDSKRQNADIGNATSAYTDFYMPVFILLSTQIDSDLVIRYTAERWLLLSGTIAGSSVESTYTFCREVVGYDLAAFFERNSKKIKSVLEGVLKALLEAK